MAPALPITLPTCSVSYAEAACKVVSNVPYQVTLPPGLTVSRLQTAHKSAEAGTCARTAPT